MQTTQQITLELNEDINYRYVYGIQFDNASRFIMITLTENGIKFIPPQKATASFRCLKPDGTSCINAAKINSDGTITAELTEQVLAVEGQVKADISLLDGKSVLSTATFFIQVEEVPSSANQITSTDEFLILNEKINEATEAINAITDTVDTANDALHRVEALEAYVGYTDNDILGLQADYENKRFTKLAGAVGLNAGDDFDQFSMYGGMKRCNVSDNGAITAYYGDDNYADDGSNGQVMVYVPRFYYKVVPLKLEKIANGFGYHIRKANYYVTDKPLAGFKLHPAFVNEDGDEVDYFLCSAYEGSVFRTSVNAYFSDAEYQTFTISNTDLLSSVSGKKPVTGQRILLTRDNAETLATNRAKGWHCQTLKSLSALQFLMMIEIGALNVQTNISMGICNNGKTYEEMNYCALTGSTSSLGNKTGTAASTAYRYYDNTAQKAVSENQTVSTAVAVSYRGIENPWGNLFKWIQGINIWGDGTMAGGQAYICDDFNFTESKKDENYFPVGFTLPEETGYPSAFGYGYEKYDWVFLPTEIKGNNQLPIGDQGYNTKNLNRYNTMLGCGAWGSNNAAGMFVAYLTNAPTYKRFHVGCRLIYVPPAE